MYREVKKFIEDNIKLIDEGRFADLKLPDDTVVQGEFWEVMRGAGINPLAYLNNIPMAYMIGENIKEFKCPSNIESIDSSAFSGCENLQKVEFNEGLEVIDSEAFYGSGLVEVSLPSSLNQIYEGAFRECEKLEKVSFKGNSLTFIGSGVFSECDSLDSITLPEGLIQLRAAVFEDCFSLEEMYLPRSLESIGNNVFSQCFNLYELNYAGTKVEWERILKPSRWKINSNLNVIHCTDGDVKLN